MQQQINNKTIKNLSLHPLQAYLTDSVQLFHIVEDIVNQIGPCNLTITSFSISEEFIRSMYRLKKKGQIKQVTLVIDSRAAQKIAKIMAFTKMVFDKLYLTNNHSKVLLFHNEKRKVSVCTSQNQTRGNRNESGIITTDKHVFEHLESCINHIINKAIDVRNIFDRNFI